MLRKLEINKRGISTEKAEKVILDEVLRFESPMERKIEKNKRGISKNMAEKSVFEELMRLKIKELTEKRKQTRYIHISGSFQILEVRMCVSKLIALLSQQ